MKFSIARVPDDYSRLRRTIDQIVAALEKTVTTLYVSVTQAGCAAATETDLFTYTVPRGTLSSVGDSLEFAACGTFASTASTNKTIRVKWGVLTIYNSGSLAITAASRYWSLRGSVTKVSATSQKCVTEISTNDSALVSSVTYTAATSDLAADVALKVCGQATNANDVVGQRFKVLHAPGTE